MLVAHIVFRFDYGGLENGVVNIINRIADDSSRHVVIALTEASGFAARLTDSATVHSIHKRPGKDFGAYLRLYRLLRQLKPDIVHTRNLGTMDCAFVAFLARVPVRIHGEHGWDVFDPDGTNSKYRLMRRVLHRFVHRIVTVSLDLKQWLITVVGVPEAKVQHICNGVDTDRFHPAVAAADATREEVVVGSVTRFSAIKDPLNLIDAFIRLRKRMAARGAAPRLAMIGDGELHQQAIAMLRDAGLAEAAWLPGSRDDIPELLQSMDIFVLGSLREGISNTVLEAMATGLPVIASDTGGNGELIAAGVNGALVPPGDSQALADALDVYLKDPERRRQHGRASRDRAVSRFSLETMVENYRMLYQSAYQVGRS